MIFKIKISILLFLSRFFPKNRVKHRRSYPQLWNCMPLTHEWPKTVHFLQWLCNFTGGHELSKTEWGYGGGDKADRWCRWCNKRCQVPKESVYFQFKESNPRELMKQVEKPTDEPS